MANTRELRRRIKSIKNTSQITKAMQMVAAVKMKRAQDQATSGRPYVENLSEALVRLLPKVDLEAHPLLGENKIATPAPGSVRDRNDGKVGVVLLSTDKGLVGALNTNLIRTLSNAQTWSGNSIFYTVGRKGRSFVARTGKDLKADFENLDTVTFRQAVQLSKLITESFLSGEIGEAYIVYPHFVSTLRQEAKRLKLLPIDLQSVILSPKDEGSSTVGNSNRSGKIATVATLPRDDKGEFLFEPNVDSLLDFILTHHIQIQIYQALLETKASEHSARMVAMKNATDNALELVEDLQLTYNQTRQEAITTELLEITTAQVAMG